jgi:hypothetical protein
MADATVTRRGTHRVRLAADRAMHYCACGATIVLLPPSVKHYIA